MKRTARDKNDIPLLKPVKQVELPTKHFALRLVAVILLVLIGAAAIAYAVSRLMNQEISGWNEISVSSLDACPEGADFTLVYDFGTSTALAKQKKRELTALYSETLANAGELFDAKEIRENKRGVAYLNQHPNETVSVDALLYRAFQKVLSDGARDLYLAPIASYYQVLVSISNNDAIAKTYDANKDPVLREKTDSFLTFCKDDQHVELRLLGNNEVFLFVSEEYLAYAVEEECQRFLDFGWMKNAFLIDAVADALIKNQYTNGYLYSYDGFARNLGIQDSYSFSVYDIVEQKIGPVATFQVNEISGMVAYRNFPIDSMDLFRFYVYDDGEIRSTYLSAQDGLAHTVTNNFMAYSVAEGCANLAMASRCFYIADEPDFEQLEGLEGHGHWIFQSDKTFYYNDAQLGGELLKEAGYTALLSTKTE